ncbi:hypothetical protein [Cyanobium sp. WAJ14-Wanaka]|uniref:hypothetical protein n=1 Tax=Cyanobium sp. WAJ14-Wanaka TaxID=2823725 RepID=UPI0020CF1FC6|nr:hypothetical protein [Cyanobium sp. WAJ14-Wanaka]MCP9775158.1 hypothetical protein [Cyanobium sp. WAJ14-Wanaka]
MAQRPWLDPLARRLLLAAGATDPTGAINKDGDKDGDVERELLALKLRQNPALRLGSAEEVRHAGALGWRLDVNRATAADWLRLPGIGPDQVDLLLRLQQGGVQLTGAEDLERALELPSAKIEGWLPVLDFRWYGEPPSSPAQPPRVNLNHARSPELIGLGLSQERTQRLIWERAREPFQDLADLQHRLQLPAALVEQWIGRVRFGPAAASPHKGGPALPLAPPKARG